MAHYWTRDDAGEWTRTPVDGEAVLLAHGIAATVGSLSPETLDTAAGVQIRRVEGSSDTWALIANSPALRLNGAPVPLGIAVLEDRDEIRLPGVHAWFSTERQAHVEPLPLAVAGGSCPRCKQAIDAGSPAVRCPGCGLWHHASDDLPCWPYAQTCATCTQVTDLDAGFRWTPGDL
jgi:hypothetical protein